MRKLLYTMHTRKSCKIQIGAAIADIYFAKSLCCLQEILSWTLFINTNENAYIGKDQNWSHLCCVNEAAFKSCSNSANSICRLRRVRQHQLLSLLVVTHSTIFTSVFNPNSILDGKLGCDTIAGVSKSAKFGWWWMATYGGCICGTYFEVQSWALKATG